MAAESVADDELLDCKRLLDALAGRVSLQTAGETPRSAKDWLDI